MITSPRASAASVGKYSMPSSPEKRQQLLTGRIALGLDPLTG
jgi:hypothetical protein